MYFTVTGVGVMLGGEGDVHKSSRKMAGAAAGLALGGDFEERKFGRHLYSSDGNRSL